MTSDDTKGYNTTIFQEMAFEIAPDMKYNPRCLCDNTCCARHGCCKACMAFHRITEHPPTCRYKWEWKPGREPVIKADMDA